MMISMKLDPYWNKLNMINKRSKQIKGCKKKKFIKIRMTIIKIKKIKLIKIIINQFLNFQNKRKMKTNYKIKINLKSLYKKMNK